MPSSAIAKIEYDELCQELIVTFVSGKTYVYQRVPRDIYLLFVNAGSKGQFFNKYIRDRYSYSQT